MNRASAVVPPLLAGRLHHRVVCSPQPPTSSGSKRARPWEDGSTTTSSNSIFRSGFIFVSDEQEGQEYSLVIPHQLLRIASHAASTGKLVQISHYALLRYKHNGWGEVLLSSSVAKNYNRKQKVTPTTAQRGEEDHLVIEIFVNGLSLTAPNNNGEETAEHETQYSDVLTLEMLASIENQQRNNIIKGNKKKSNNDKHVINVAGVVDAISPILVNDPRQEPFAILELYQSPMAEEEECTRTAVVVIRGEKALSMHPAIHPGQTITLLDVAHRKWKVPDEFRKRASSNETQNNECNLYDRLRYRVQGRVILVTEATSIKWNDGVSRKSDLTLPSTVDTLTSIRGIVKSVHYHCIDNRNGKENRILHFVTIKLLNSKEKKLARIYLPKYVVSPNTSLGLQPESIVRVVNVHAIPPPTDEVKKCPSKRQISNEFLCYVACLRSTISIERCAGESSYSNRSANIWFVPSCKPFLIVPDHRISDICGDPFHSKSSAQLSAEESLQYNSLLTNNIPNDALRTLLEYHHHNIAKDSEENVRCICPKRKSEIMNEKNDRQAIRDPYCEFFDHAHSDLHDDRIECGSCSSSFSCFNHFRQATSETMPIAIDMEHIRNACTQHFIQSTGSKCRRDVQSQAAELQAGWTDSVSFEGLQLLQVLNEYLLQAEKDTITWLDTSSDLINIYTCGQIKLSGQNFNTSIYIDNGTCAIPVCETNTDEKCDRSRIKSTPPGDSFAWAHVDSISVSCLCLGPSVSKKGTTIHRVFPHVFLPTSVGKSFDSLPGNTFLFLVDNIVFIGSLSIITKSLLEVIGDQSRTLEGPSLEESDKNENDRHVKEPHASLLSIGSCLEETETSQSKDDPSSILLGRRIRHSFKFRKVKSAHISGTPLESPLEKCYEGWSITLCHVDNDGCGGVSNMASTLQTIDVTISIPFSKKKMETNHNDCVISLESLKSGLRELFDNSPNATSHGDRISSDQETMCLAWWRASACSDTLPILSGGWDVYVEIPLNGRTFAKLGYQRFRCSFDALKAYHVVESHPIPPQVFNNSNKVLPGILNLRLRRQTPSLPSPLIYMNTGGGVSSVSLADLHWDICEAIRKDDSSCMKPSLLRRLHDVKILGISFCRARVECRRCFQALIKKGGKIESIETNSTEEVFLVCPSGCSIHQASVKWECSAIVDDGTGQAKLYAEREAALLLLGAGLDVTTVETGAWYCDEGVFFQPSLPPSSNLTQSIRIASAKARKLITGKQKRNIAEELLSTYHLLPDIAKAEYLLQQHCRHWSQQHGQRRLDLFCRVKPLSEDLSLNSTEINVAKARVAHVGLEFGMTPAATLPPLKLNLEDACLCCEQRHEDNVTGWNVQGKHFNSKFNIA